MSWAARRSTTRPEDVAYSLMGIFDINMPMLYGEGSKAFLRLQEELIKQTDDQSIFAWDLQHSILDWHNRYYGLLSPTVKAYSNSKGIVDLKHYSAAHVRKYSEAIQAIYSHDSWPTDLRARTGHVMTSTGLSIKLFIFPWTLYIYGAALICTDAENSHHIPCIFLHYLSESQYARVSPGAATHLILDRLYNTQHTLMELLPDTASNGVDMMIRQNPSQPPVESKKATMSIRELVLDGGTLVRKYNYLYRHHNFFPPFSVLEQSQRMFKWTDHPEFATVSGVSDHCGQIIGAVRFGFNFKFRPTLIACTIDQEKCPWGAGRGIERHVLRDLWKKYANLSASLPRSQQGSYHDSGEGIEYIVDHLELYVDTDFRYFMLQKMDVTLRSNRDFGFRRSQNRLPYRFVIDIEMRVDENRRQTYILPDLPCSIPTPWRGGKKRRRSPGQNE